MTSGAAPVLSTVSGKTADDQSKKMRDPVKVIKVVCDAADATSGEKKPPAYDEATSFPWTHRYPAKLKAVLWNFTQNSAKLVCFLFPASPLVSTSLTCAAVTAPSSSRKPLLRVMLLLRQTACLHDDCIVLSGCRVKPLQRLLMRLQLAWRPACAPLVRSPLSSSANPRL